MLALAQGSTEQGWPNKCGTPYVSHPMFLNANLSGTFSDYRNPSTLRPNLHWHRKAPKWGMPLISRSAFTPSSSVRPASTVHSMPSSRSSTCMGAWASILHLWFQVFACLTFWERALARWNRRYSIFCHLMTHQAHNPLPHVNILRPGIHSSKHVALR